MGSVLQEMAGKGIVTGKIASTAGSSSGQTGSGGKAVGVSGSAALNLVYDNTGAYIRDTGAFTVSNGKSLNLDAENKTTVVTVAGSVAYASSSSGTSSTGISGAVGLNIMSGTTEAYIDTVASLLVGGALTINSKRSEWVVSVAAGLSGATGKDGTAVAGSATANILYSYNTYADLRNISGGVSVGGAASLDADDETNLIGIAGSAGFGGKGGFGVSFDVSYTGRTTEAEVSNIVTHSGIVPSFGSLDVEATIGGIIIGATGSVGVSTGSGGKGYAAAGTVGVNVTIDTVQADITDSNIASTGA